MTLTVTCSLLSGVEAIVANAIAPVSPRGSPPRELDFRRILGAPLARVIRCVDDAGAFGLSAGKGSTTGCCDMLAMI